MWRQAFEMDPRLRQHWQVQAKRYPSWVVKGTLLVVSPFLMLLALTAVLCLLAALIVGALAFVLLSSVARVLHQLTGHKQNHKQVNPAEPQRENVRVVRGE